MEDGKDSANESREEIRRTETADTLPAPESAADNLRQKDTPASAPTSDIPTEAATAEHETTEPAADTAAEGALSAPVSEPAENSDGVLPSAEKRDFREITDAAAVKRRTFSSRMGDAGYVAGRRYDAVKNAFLCWKSSGRSPQPVRSRFTSGCETFYSGRRIFGKLYLVGGYLRLFLALDPKAYAAEKYHHKDYSEVARYSKCPLMIKLSSDRQVKNALALISDVMTAAGFARDENYVPKDQANVFKKSRAAKTRIVYVPARDDETAAAVAPGQGTDESEAVVPAADARLPVRAGVYNSEGDRIGRVRRSVWYDEEGSEVGAFTRTDEAVYFGAGGERKGYVDGNDNVLTLSGGYMATLKRMSRLPLLLLVIILALLTALSVLLAAYLMSRSGGDYAPVLFVADAEGLSWDETENLPVFMNERFGDTVIAPGMEGSYSFTLKNENADALDFSLTFSESNEYGIDIAYRLRRDGAYISQDEYVSAAELGVRDMSIESGSSTVFTLEWIWRDGDEADTAAGEAGATYTLTITFTASVRG